MGNQTKKKKNRKVAKAIWGATRPVALVFNTLLSGIDLSIGKVQVVKKDIEYHNSHKEEYAKQAEEKRLEKQETARLKKEEIEAEIAVVKKARLEAKKLQQEMVDAKKAAKGEERKVASEKKTAERKAAVEKKTAERKAAVEKKTAEIKKKIDTEKEIRNKIAAEKKAIADARNEAKRLDREKKEQEKKEQEDLRLERERIQREEYEAIRREAQLAREKAEKERIEKLEAQRAAFEAARIEHEKIRNEKLALKEASKVEKEKLKAEIKANKAAKLEVERLEKERILKEAVAQKERENLESERLAVENAKKEIEALVLERTKMEEASKAEQAKLEAEILAAEEARREAEKIQQEKIATYESTKQVLAKIEEERAAAEKARQEAEAVAKEKLASYEESKKEQEKLEEGRAAVESARQEAEELEKARLEYEEATRREKQKLEEERQAVAAAKKESERLEQAKLESLEATKLVQEKIEAEVLAVEAVKREAEKLEAEKIASNEEIRRGQELIEEHKQAIEEANIEAERLEKVRLETEEIVKQEQAKLEENKAAAEYAKQQAEILEKQRQEAKDNAKSKIESIIADKTAVKAARKESESLEREVDYELQKLRREADKYAEEEKKREKTAERIVEKNAIAFEKYKQLLKHFKKAGKTSSKVQNIAKTSLHKWSAYLLHFAICIVVSIITCFFVMWLQPDNAMHANGLLIMNLLPILITGWALAFICQNAFISSAINLLVWSLLSIANTIKIDLRDDPVYPGDLLLLKEASEAMKEYNITLPVEDLEILLCTIIVLVICGIVYAIENKGKIRVIVNIAGKLKCAIVRFGGFILCIAIFLAVVFGYYANDDVYHQFELENYDHMSETYNELGFPFSFCHYFKAFSVDKPEGYNEDEAMFYGQNIKTEDAEPNIHVIMIMDEAYSDLTDLDIINFKDNDPLFMFKKMAQSENGISGHIVVPGFAGGTAFTEFDVVTGMQTNMLSDTNITAFRSMKTKQESLMSVLGNSGYTTQYTHVGRSWYYNRENAYKLLGTDETKFIDDMTNIKYKGYWVSDEYVGDIIQERFNEAVENNEWLFSYNVTIQNHMSYTAEKYAGWEPEKVDILATLSDDMADALGVYTMGVRDANYMLYRLYNFFNETDEPVMLVFFGDHMPYLGDNRQGYKELGIDNVYSEDQDDALKMYETPYLIWCNDAGAKAINFKERVKELNMPEDGVIQSSYLGSVVLDLIGQSKTSKWFSYLSEARQALPVTKYADESNEYIQRLKNWTYYKITN